MMEFNSHLYFHEIRKKIDVHVCMYACVCIKLQAFIRVGRVPTRISGFLCSTTKNRTRDTWRVVETHDSMVRKAPLRTEVATAWKGQKLSGTCDGQVGTFMQHALFLLLLCYI